MPSLAKPPLGPRPHILGVDPGFGGALAVINPTDQSPVAVYDMPLSKLRDRNSIHIEALVDLISYHAKDLKLCLIERVGPAPRQGLASTFRFGEGYGLIQGIVSALQIPMLTVSPAAWKAAMGATADKNLSRQIASRMFPQAAKHLSRVKDDGRAEALLIAAYGANIRDVFAVVEGDSSQTLN